MSASVTYGLLFAVVSLLCNGSFSSLNKLPSVVKSKVHPSIFNLYFICGTVFSCIVVYIVLVAIDETVTITYLGIISGFLLSLAGITTFAAIGHIGLSVGVAIWSGTAILVSFVEGLVLNPHLYSWSIAILGALVLIIGIITVSFSELLAQLCCHRRTCKYVVTQNKTSVNNADLCLESQNLLSTEQQNCNSLREQQNIWNDDGVETYGELRGTRWFLGIFYAVLTGILGGSIGFPSNWTDQSNHDAKYLISFAIGASLVFPITWITERFFREDTNHGIKWEFGTCFIPGMVAGVIWNGGNLASLYAIEMLGYSVAYPIMQSSLIVASIWGIFVWKEFINKHVILFLFLGAITVIAGCVLITYGIDA